MGGAILCGLTYAIITIYNVVGPFLVQTELGYNAIVYGHIALGLGVAWIVGIFIYRLVLAKMKLKGLFHKTLIVYFLVTLVMLALGFFSLFDLATTVLPPALIFVCGAIIFTHSFAHTISKFPEIGGAASAAMGSIFSIISGLASGVASFLNANSLVPLALAYFALIVLGYILYRIFLHRDPSF